MKNIIRYHARATMAAALVLVHSGVASAQTTPERIKAAVGAIDSAAIQANAATSKDWPTVGADYAETRYSKLNEINDKNIKDLGLIWTYSLDSTHGVESTPLVVDSIMYVTTSWSVVHTIDVRSDKRLWSF